MFPKHALDYLHRDSKLLVVFFFNRFESMGRIEKCFIFKMLLHVDFLLSCHNLSLTFLNLCEKYVLPTCFGQCGNCLFILCYQDGNHHERPDKELAVPGGDQATHQQAAHHRPQHSHTAHHRLPKCWKVFLY